MLHRFLMNIQVLAIIFITMFSSFSIAEEHMKTIESKTNFMHAPTGLVAEKKAYKELTSYLINLGKYPDAELADIDAQQRVDFFEQLDLYTSDPQLKNASIFRKKIHALIYGHELHDVIVANDGFLPDVK